jgi:hypothetical protein
MNYKKYNKPFIGKLGLSLPDILQRCDVGLYYIHTKQITVSIIQLKMFADTYEEAVKLAEDFYLQTGRVVAVERVAQHP